MSHTLFHFSKPSSFPGAPALVGAYDFSFCVVRNNAHSNTEFASGISNPSGGEEKTNTGLTQKKKMKKKTRLLVFRARC